MVISASSVLEKGELFILGGLEGNFVATVCQISVSLCAENGTQCMSLHGQNRPLDTHTFQVSPEF